MAGANLIFKNPRTGIIKVAPTGFSWTVLPVSYTHLTLPTTSRV